MKMTIGTKIQTLRKQHGLSQEQLAETLGVSRQAVSKWEAEQSVPDIDKIILICDYFGVTTDYILRNEDLSCSQIAQSTNAIENEEKKENTENKKKSTILLAVAVMLYILCIVPIILIQNTFGVVLMFVIIAVATGIIIYRSIFSSNNKSDDEEKDEKPENPILKAVKSCVWAVAVIIYFVISFLSSAWYITWLVFPITGAITDVIEACFDLKGGDNK